MLLPQQTEVALAFHPSGLRHQGHSSGLSSAKTQDEHAVSWEFWRFPAFCSRLLVFFWLGPAPSFRRRCFRARMCSLEPKTLTLPSKRSAPNGSTAALCRFKSQPGWERHQRFALNVKGEAQMAWVSGSRDLLCFHRAWPDGRMEAAYTPGWKEAGAALVCLAEKGCANAKSEKFCQFFCHFRCEMLVVYCSGPTLLVSNVTRNLSNFCFWVARYPCHQPLIWFMAVGLSRSEGSMDPPKMLRWNTAAKQLFSVGVVEAPVGRKKTPSLLGRPCQQPVFSRILKASSEGMNLTCLICTFACSVIFHSPLRSFRGWRPSSCGEHVVMTSPSNKSEIPGTVRVDWNDTWHHPEACVACQR